MTRDRHPQASFGDDGVLGHVSAWLQRLSQQPQTRLDSPIDQPRFYRDVGEWVSCVRDEMRALCDGFQRSADASVAAENIAAAMSRIRLRAGAIELPPTPIRMRTRADDGPTARLAVTAPPELPPHQREAAELRRSVATLREKLAAERAEQARAAADERRRYVESIRDGLRAARPATPATRVEAQSVQPAPIGADHAEPTHPDASVEPEVVGPVDHATPPSADVDSTGPSATAERPPPRPGEANAIAAEHAEHTDHISHAEPAEASTGARFRRADKPGATPGSGDATPPAWTIPAPESPEWASPRFRRVD